MDRMYSQFICYIPGDQVKLPAFETDVTDANHLAVLNDGTAAVYSSSKLTRFNLRTWKILNSTKIKGEMYFAKQMAEVKFSCKSLLAFCYG